MVMVANKQTVTHSLAEGTTVIVTNGVLTSGYAMRQHLTAWRVRSFNEAPTEVELSVRYLARVGRYRAYVRHGDGWRLVQAGESYYTTYRAARAAIVRRAAASERLASLNHRWWRKTLSRARKLPRGASGRRSRR